MTAFRSCYAKRLEDYARLRRNMGLSFDVQTYVLRRFDAYCIGVRHRGFLTQSLALDFASQGGSSASQCARHYQIVRHFAEYLSAFSSGAPRLDPKIVTRRKVRPIAYIYSGDEIAQLLRAALATSRRHRIRGETLHAMVGLGAATGLRISEVVNLDRGDVDLTNSVLTVRRGKFGKDRLVPLHATTTAAMRAYAATRDLYYPEGVCTAFFLHLWGGRFSRHTLQMAFWQLTRDAGIRHSRGRGPSFHALRHTFAVRTLERWYREGRDVQGMLPTLATYMGHTHYTDTAYYLRATPELMKIACERQPSISEVTHGDA